MGYDVQFVQIDVPSKTSFPVAEGKAGKLLSSAGAFDDPDAVRAILLEIEGCRHGPGDAVDFLGRGLSHARFFVRDDAIHVENDCSANDLLRIFKRLAEDHPTLLILDLQSKQLHSPASFAEWWAKPL